MFQNLIKSTKDVFSKLSTNQLQSIKKTPQIKVNLNNDKKLMVYNSFTKKKEIVKINNKDVLISNNNNDHNLRFAKAYICGPTVYDESHIGHAMTYLRFDLIRRILKRYCSIDLMSIINITDIDDKIINKSKLENKSCDEISNYYLSSFLKDLHALNILPFNAYIPVTSQIDNIIKFIQELELNNLAYFNEKTGDIDLDTSKIDFELDNFKIDQEILPGRRSTSDFTLWKSFKPNEPFWEYKSKLTNKLIKGRPGWHVECSVINRLVLGNRIDFHFGGHDLFFPHHVNESRCCKAFNLISSNSDNLKADDSIHKWSNNWLHFGSLKIKEEKMSKSLNNFIQIKKFLRKNSKNLLRILCIIHPYRRDITFDDGNLKIVQDLDIKIINFYQLLNNQKNKLIESSNLEFKDTNDLNCLIKSFIQHNLDGISDDFNLNNGWLKLIELINYGNQNINNISLYDLIKLELIINDYFNTMGLIYQNSNLFKNRNPNDQLIIQKLVNYRKDVRKLTLDEYVNCKNRSENIKSILKLTDNIRDNLKSNHLIIRDDKFN